MSLKDSYKIIKAELGYRATGLSVMIDLVNACSFTCPSCPVGSLGVKKKGSMTLEKFWAILDRIQGQTKIKYVLLYDFGEPLLSPIVADAVGELKSRKIRSMISTNLSHPSKLYGIFENGLDELRISFSGFAQGEYFHRGRKMQRFRSACDQVTELMKEFPHTKVSLIFHQYKTNEWETQEVEMFAERHNFNLIYEKAFFIPFETIIAKNYTEADKQLISHLYETPEESSSKFNYQEYCFYQRQQIVVDANGHVLLCRHVYKDELIVGDIMVDSIDDLRQRMIAHPFCIKCKGAKLNAYTP
jgi:MoaA/NifB/PqqE/SkfB family radical SAM enzyme